MSRQLHSHSPTSSRQNTYKTKQTCNNYDLSINNTRLASVLQPLTSNSSGQQVNYALIFTIVQFPTPSLSDNVLFCLFSCSAMMTALRMASYSLLQLAASSGSVCETYAIKQVGMFQHGTPESRNAVYHQMDFESAIFRYKSTSRCFLLLIKCVSATIYDIYIYDHIV